MRTSRKEWLISLLLLGIPAMIYLRSEIRWAEANSPTGKFSNAAEYLKTNRPPSRVRSLTKNGHAYLIAYSPMDSGLAIPSGPAAYVFNETGQLVDWSGDVGDDPKFQSDWPVYLQRKAYLEDLRKTASRSDGVHAGTSEQSSNHAIAPQGLDE